MPGCVAFRASEYLGVYQQISRYTRCEIQVLWSGTNLVTRPWQVAGRPGWWAEKANCFTYAPASGGMSFSGCAREAINASHITCVCEHLSAFSAGVDPTTTACSDGEISGY
jgi:hypothetical protein